jgi:hypothetical protein
VSTSAAVSALQLAIDELRDQRAELRLRLGEIDSEIKRHEHALDALNGEHSRGRHQRSGIVVLAALNSFGKPVTSTTLFKHPDLVHYAESTLRRALTDLHRRGLIVSVERSPKGNVWVVSDGAA